MFDNPVLFEILAILGLILLNGVFAMSEMALVSARLPRLRQRAEDGSRGARRALEMAEEQTRFLSTVQVGITTIGILAGAYGGASLAAHLDVWLERYPGLADYSEGLALAAVVIAITFMSLVVGELVPKRIALEYPEAIASVLARPMHLLSIAAGPLVRFLSATTEAVVRILRLPPATDRGVTEDDITALVEEGAASGVFELEEAGLVERIFRLGDQKIGALMTPRGRIAWLNVDDPPAALVEELRTRKHSRYLVAERSVDNVVGMVRAVELLPQLVAGGELDLRTHMERPLFVPESLPALRLLARFRDSGVHLAVVVDEHGGVEGLVTLNDVLDEIAGELDPEATEPIRQREDGSWLVDGSTAWADFVEEMNVRDVAADRRPYDTVGGMVLAHLGHIPISGEHFDAVGFRFEVVDMDGKRIDKLLVSRAGAQRQPG